MAFLFTRPVEVSNTPEHEVDPTLAEKLEKIADDYNERTHKLSAAECQRLVNMIVSRAKQYAEEGLYRCSVRLTDITRDADRASYTHWCEADQRVLKEVRDNWHLRIGFSESIYSGSCSSSSGYLVAWATPVAEVPATTKDAAKPEKPDEDDVLDE
jgi:hypothetical protein